MRIKQTIKESMTSTAWGQSGASVRRAAITLLVMLLAATGAWAQTGNWVDYRAESLTESDDHETIYISTAEELALYAYNVNHDVKNAKGYYCARTVELQADIDLGAHYWTPIGTGRNIYFNGRFNGNGHVITGMNVNSDCSTDRFGFIGYFEGRSNSHIDNIIFKDCHVSGSIPLVSAGGVGIVVGYYLADETGSSVTNCLVLDCSVDESDNNGRPEHGAIVGYGDNDFIVSNNYYYNMTGDYGGGMSKQRVVEDVDGARRAYAVTLPNGITANASTGISYGGKFYTADGATVTLSHNRPGYIFLGYLSDAVTITDDTFTMPDADATIDASWANPDDISINDEGTEYTIKTAEGWNVFCNLLEGGETFLGKTVYLGASIEVSRMAGDQAHGFAGTFDGQNNTLTFNYGTAESPADEQFVAPFSFTVSGTSPVFRDLTIDGDIYATHTEATDHDHAGGLIAHLFGTVTIDNCVSNVRITTTGEDGAGGFVGLCENSVKFTNCKSSAVVTSDSGNNSGFVGWSRSSEYLISFEGCLFNGKLLMKDNNGGYNGGFVGWKGDGKTVTIDNCLYIPAEPAGSEELANNYSANFCRQHDDKLPAVINNCYYISSITQYYGAVQGKAPLSVTAGENVTVEAVSPVGDATKTYSVSGITAYAQGITCDGTFYYGSGDKVSLTLSHGDAPEGYALAGYTASPEGATLTGNANPYTLTMPDSNVQIGARFVIPIPYIDKNGKKQTCTDYTIITDDMNIIGIAGKETWYVIEGDITIDYFDFHGNVHLILADDASCNVYDIYGDDRDGVDNLTIYGQDKGNGRLAINDDGIYIEDGSLTINGGEVDVKASSKYGIYIRKGHLIINGGKVDVDIHNDENNYAIYIANGRFYINGGQVDVKGKFYGNYNGERPYYIYIGWTRPEDYISLGDFPDPYYVVRTSGRTFTNGYNLYNGSFPASKLSGTTLFGVHVLNNASDNNIASLNGKNTNVFLNGRTLYKDGSWNTLCLPFDLDDFTDTPLQEAKVMTLGDASFANGTLTLNFKDATTIEAGKPYIVKWTRAEDYVDDNMHNLCQPIFKDVVISNAQNDVKTPVVVFKGLYNPLAIAKSGDNTKLYLNDNNLYYPEISFDLNAFHAYFQLADGLMSDNVGDVNGDGEITATDVTALVNYVLSNNDDNVVKENADITGDGEITATDVSALVNWVLNGKPQFNVILNAGDDTITFQGGGSGPARVKKIEK